MKKLDVAQNSDEESLHRSINQSICGNALNRNEIVVAIQKSIRCPHEAERYTRLLHTLGEQYHKDIEVYELLQQQTAIFGKSHYSTQKYTDDLHGVKRQLNNLRAQVFNLRNNDKIIEIIDNHIQLVVNQIDRFNGLINDDEQLYSVHDCSGILHLGYADVPPKSPLPDYSAGSEDMTAPCNDRDVDAMPFSGESSLRPNCSYLDNYYSPHSHDTRTSGNNSKIPNSVELTEKYLQIEFSRVRDSETPYQPFALQKVGYGRAATQASVSTELMLGINTSAVREQFTARLIASFLAGNANTADSADPTAKPRCLFAGEVTCLTVFATNSTNGGKNALQQELAEPVSATQTTPLHAGIAKRVPVKAPRFGSLPVHQSKPPACSEAHLGLVLASHLSERNRCITSALAPTTLTARYHVPP